MTKINASSSAAIGSEDAGSPWNGRSGRSEQRRLIKRKAILTVAARLFAERGFHHVSLDEIAEQLEVTKPTLYYYFKNKNQLFYECANIGFNMLEDAYAQLETQPTTGINRLQKFLQTYMEYIQTDYGRALIRVGDYELAPDERARVRQLLATTDRRLRKLVNDAMEDGSAAASNPKLIAFALGGLINSVGHWYRGSNDADGNAIIKHFLWLVTNGLLPRELQDGDANPNVDGPT